MLDGIPRCKGGEDFIRGGVARVGGGLASVAKIQGAALPQFVQQADHRGGFRTVVSWEWRFWRIVCSGWTARVAGILRVGACCVVVLTV